MSPLYTYIKKPKINTTVPATSSVITHTVNNAFLDKWFDHNHTELLKYLLSSHKYSRYLEIGVLDDVNFNQINVPFKIGVDPIAGGTHRMTSDEFFATNKDKFDLIFIDGDHHHNQVYKDIINAIDALMPNGVIILHDCYPPIEADESATRCGTAWRAFVEFRQRNDLDMMVGDFDYGVGIIKKRTNTMPIILPKPFGELTYEELMQNKNSWMRLGDWETIIEFVK